MSNLSSPSGRRLVAVLLTALGLAGAAGAQVTTGTLAGRVTAESDGSMLPGVTIHAVHEPTGTAYTTTVGDDGRFALPNVRVGGPYRVTATLDGFQTKEVSAVSVSLGATTELVIPLAVAALAESIEVVGTADEFLNPNRAGAASAVSLEQIETLPTLRRTLQDFARTNPYFVVDNNDASSTRVSVAGRNNRYNSIQIDGAVNNDLFGLADTGTPGGAADTQPISLDAIQEIQLVVSPYDVRQGGFTGGGINAITRSGANAFSGSIYGSTRDEDSVGELDGRDVSEFKEEQVGGRLGGPIVQDKAFFFVSAEMNRNDTPTGFSADGGAPNQFRNPALAGEVDDILTNTYGFDPGGLNEFVEGTNSDLIFARVDWNAAPSHLLTLRHNFVDADKDRIESGDRNTTSRFSFPSYYYPFVSETNSTVLQLNSTFSSMFNEARIGYQRIREERAVAGRFPDVEVRDAGLEVNAGINRFSHRNALDQDILEITDDLTILHGNHTFTVGTHNEFFTFSNLFIDAADGFYGFASLAAFEAGQANSYTVGFPNTGNERVEFDVNQYGLYGGDQWRVNDRFTMQFGLRIDMPTFPDSPSRNPLVDDALGIDTSDAPDSMVLIQPRVGFNWSPDDRQQLRGGIGIFAGRTPYVWMSNNYQNSGVEFSVLNSSCTPTPCTVVQFDPSQPPPTTGSGGLPTIDAVDPDFEFPQVLRATVGYDREIFWDMQATAELLWSQSVEDAYYTNANLAQTGTLPDGRPRYGRRDSRIFAVYELNNTSEGEEMSASFRLRKLFDFGLDVTAQYVYSDAEAIAELTSSRAVSNFRFAPQTDPLRPDVATTFFEIEDRFTVTASYRFETGPVGHNLALFYNVLSGAPYTMRFANDVNGDTADGNDLLFVPASADDVVLTGGLTWDQLNGFISSVDCLSEARGGIVDRNACNAPWTHQLDFHYGVEVPIRVVRAEVTLDVLNFLNLIDSDQGRFRIVTNNAYAPIRGAVDSATGKWSYSPAFTGALNEGAQFTTNDLRSRWQAKLGLRLSF